MRLRVLAVTSLLLPCVLLLTAGCGGGGDDEPEPTTTTEEVVATTVSSTTTSTAAAAAAAADGRDWDGARFDIGIVNRIDRTEDGLTLVVFDRMQLATESGRKEGKDFTTEPIVVGNTDYPFVNESKRLRTYVAAPGMDVLVIANLGQICDLDGNGAEPRWEPTTVDRAVDTTLWEEHPQVSLSFTPGGRVSRLRFASGC